jgi:type IV pilus assembly protein PilM
MARSVVGLDIGHGVIRAAELVNPSRSRPTLVRYHEVPIPLDAVSKGEVIDAPVVTHALKGLWNKARFRTRDVVLGMGNQRIVARDYVVPAMPLDRIRESLPFQVQDMLTVPVTDALLDFYPISREETHQGPMVHGLLVAAIKEAVLGNVSAVEAAGLHVAEVDLIPFALARLLLGTTSSSTVTALVNIGASTTNVVLAVGSVPHFVRVIPSGGREISEALVAKFGLSFNDAERIKRQIGVLPQLLSPEQRPMVEAIQETAGELIANVRNTITYFVNGHPDKPVSQILLSGGGSAMPGIRDAFREFTRLPVIEADPFAQLSVARSASDEYLRASRDNLAVAVGLAVGSVA